MSASAPAGPITGPIDSHLHVWTLGDSPYSWLSSAPVQLRRTFELGEARTHLEAAGVEAVVLVQADDTWAETQCLLDVADANDDLVLGVVGWLPLESPEETARCLDLPGLDPLTGVRHLVHDDPRADFLDLDAVQESLALLARHRLVLDVPDAWPRHLDQAVRVADRHPDLVVVIDHLAKPPRGTHQMAAWAEALREAGRRPNVRAKVSGLQVPGQPYDADSLRPVLHHALEAFGPDRLMYGGDWPMTVPAGGYAPHWTVVRELLAELGAAEQHRILTATAFQTYRGGVDE